MLDYLLCGDIWPALLEISIWDEHREFIFNSGGQILAVEEFLNEEKREESMIEYKNES